MVLTSESMIRNLNENTNYTTYSYEEAMERSLDYFSGDELAASTFVNKYSLRNNDLDILEDVPEKMHRRLAKEFARIEKKYKNALSEEEIFNLFDRFKYIIPQGSPMSAIGNPFKIQSASNCFVIPSPLDSYSGILKTDQEQAQIMKRRGGVGFDVSNIRPKGLITQNAARTTDGIGVFIERFSNTCREVAQSGRRGALMLSLSVNHPEIDTFIKIKRDLKKVTGANISIRLGDDFMNAVKNDDYYYQQWPVDSDNPVIKNKVRAREVWNEIIHSAWLSAEPGLLFWSNAQKYTPADIYKDFGYESISTNPCGEIILSADDSCRLMVINLISFVDNPYTKNAKFDFEKYADVVKKAQKLMDDMIDIEIELIDKILKKIDSDPEPYDVKKIEIDLWERIRKACSNGRRTGLGITALGDTLAALGIRYGSKKSIKVTEEIYKNLAVNSYISSCEMARDRGAFPVFSRELEKGHVFIERILNESEELRDLYNKYGRRNIANTTTAPTGSVSILTQSTSGIEPAYLVSYKRRKKVNPNDESIKVDFVDELGDSWQEYTVYHHGYKKWMEISGKDSYEESPYYKATSNDVDWVSSVDLQAAAQKWVCHAISKTCNLPNDVPEKVVSDVYMRAWESGCKGFTVYRDGSRSGVLISESKKDEKQDKKGIIKTDAPKRPNELNCDVHHIKVKGEDFFVIVGLLDNDPYEIFSGRNGQINKKVKTGKIIKEKRGRYHAFFDDDTEMKNINEFITEDQEAITRLVSTSLRHGADINFVVHQLEKTKGDMQSFAKSISRALKKYIKDGTTVHGESCMNCSSENSLQRKEGCIMCMSCGWTKCG